MKNWINDIRNFFERKSNNTNDKVKRTKICDNGLVKDRIKFFDNPAVNNEEPPGSDRPRTRYSKRKISCDELTNYDNENNMDSIPSMVVNKDQMCIYQSMDAIYGSFKIREQSVVNGEYEENNVIMRLKVREMEHQGVRRYESMLKAPLSQQVIVSKYKDHHDNSPPGSPDSDSRTNVTSMIDKWNQQCLSNKEKEDFIDLALLKSIRKKRSVPASTPGKHINILQLLEDNQSLTWADTEMVRSTDLLDKLSREEVFFQESQFELISSEASYYRSLNVLVDKFYNSPLLSLENQNRKNGKVTHIKAHQKEHLFSNILQIHSISGKFLAELEKRFTESVVMTDVCDIVTKYAEDQFQVYVPYIQNQKFQTEAYNELKKNEGAAKVIEKLEAQPECCSLSLDSFLLLPMQRLLRILLLLKAIKKNAPDSRTLSSNSAEKAINAVENIITQCSAKKGHMDERQRMLEISSSLTFKLGQTFFSISSGTLIHEGEVKCQMKGTGGRGYWASFRKTVFYALLILTDEYLLITKIVRNKEVSYVVEDWCQLADMVLNVSSTDGEDSRDFNVTLRKSITYSLQPKSREECTRWIKELSSCLKTTTTSTN